MKRNEGFTLIELMIVVGLLALIATIAIPKFASAIQKSREGSVKGNLGVIRSALSVYYADQEGQYPSDLGGLTVNGKYLSGIPSVKGLDTHSDSAVVAGLTAPDDSGGWAYDNVMGTANFGTLWVNCTHLDLKGSVWSTY